MEVAASAERAWAAVVDFESRARHGTRVKSVRLPDGPLLREGSRIELQVGRDRFTPRVVFLKPQERLELTVQGLGFRARHAYQVTGGATSSAVTMTAEYGGFFGTLAAVAKPSSIQRDLREELGAIKAEAEKPPK